MAAQPTPKQPETKTELVRTEPAAMATSTSSAGLLGVIERAMTSPDFDIEKMERLFALLERNQANERAAAYADDMAKCQAEIGPAKRTGQIAHNGKVISNFAKLEDLDKQIRPITSKYGFSLAFNATSLENGKTRHTLKVTHRQGHFEVFEFDAAPDTGGAKNAIQAQGSATTYAKRYLTKGAFNIVETDEDDDGGASGKRPDLMSAEHVADIKLRLRDARDAGLPGFEDAKILNWKRVLAFEDIRDEEYQGIVDEIARLRKKREADASNGARR